MQPQTIVKCFEVYSKKYSLFIKREKYQASIIREKEEKEEKRIRNSIQRIEREAERIAEEARQGSLQRFYEDYRIAREKRIISEYGTKKAALILNGQVELGFTKDMCLEAWGIPDNLTKSLVGNIIHETWEYTYIGYDGRIHTKRLRFEANKLVSFSI